MKPFSMSSIYLTAFLCLGLSSNTTSVNLQQQPRYLSKYSTSYNPHMPVLLTQWRATIESSFLRSENEAGSWNVSDSNVTCILLNGIVKLTINYTDINNNTKLGNVDVPSFATASGSCVEQYITLSWQEGGNSSSSQPPGLNNTLTFQFNANEKRKVTGAGEMNLRTIPSGKFAIIAVSAEIRKNEHSFPNATNASDPFVINQKGLAIFPTTLNRSFACDAIITIGSPTTDRLTVLMQNSQIEAYRKVAKGSDTGKFSAAEHCAADEIFSGSVVVTVIISILSIVLIALGAAVIATYILKKRRAAGATGYETM